MSSVKLRVPKIANCRSQSVLLKIIRDHGTISRSRLVEHSDQPLAAISRTVSRLMDDGIVHEIPMGDATGPRRKRALCLNPQLGHCLSIHYGPDEIVVAAIDTAYGMIAECEQRLSLRSLGRDEKIRALIEFIKQFRASLPASVGKCLAMAVVDPGVIDEANGVILMSSILEHWTQVPIVEVMEKEFGLPVLLTSTSTAGIRAVDRFELKNAFPNFVYVEYHSGIACGIKLQGNYVIGRSHLAGEFGHIKATDQPIPCRCGSIGCLEAVAALPALAKKFQDMLSSMPGGGPDDLQNIDGIDVLRRAAAGDRLAERIVEEAYVYLGSAIGGLVNLLAPEVVMLDHRIGLAGNEAVTVLLQAVRRNMLTVHAKDTELRISQLTPNITARGGAVELLDAMIDYA